MPAIEHLRTRAWPASRMLTTIHCDGLNLTALPPLAMLYSWKRQSLMVLSLNENRDNDRQFHKRHQIWI
jgi:hypothetical protein